MFCSVLFSLLFPSSPRSVMGDNYPSLNFAEDLFLLKSPFYTPSPRTASCCGAGIFVIYCCSKRNDLVKIFLCVFSCFWIIYWINIKPRQKLQCVYKKQLVMVTEDSVVPQISGSATQIVWWEEENPNADTEAWVRWNRRRTIYCRSIIEIHEELQTRRERNRRPD